VEVAFMITSFSVKGLFGRFDYKVQLKDGGITLLTGPNGFGKSTLFTLLESVVKGDEKKLKSLAFSSLNIASKSGEFTLLKKDVEKTNLKGLSANFGRVETVGSRRFLDGALRDDGELRSFVEFIKGIPQRVANASKTEDGAKRVKLLLELLSDKLAFKRAELNNGELKFIDENGDKLAFTDLSAGEIQLTAFYTELLFDAGQDTLLLIDEPEMSMHIIWQFTLVDEVERICALTGARAIIATHSPQVLNGRFDLQVDLGEQYGG
jgi:predicted ATPase